MAFPEHVIDLVTGPRAPARRAARAENRVQRLMHSDAGPDLPPRSFPCPPARQTPGLIRQIGKRPFERAEAAAQPVAVHRRVGFGLRGYTRATLRRRRAIGLAVASRPPRNAMIVATTASRASRLRVMARGVTGQVKLE
jgi:hypothetical protein